MTRRVLASLIVFAVAACSGSGTAGAGTASHHAVKHGAAVVHRVPQFAHIVVVMEENHSYDDIIGNADAPYFNRLANTGALLTNSFGVTHPSEPNYLALFSGSTHGLTDDSCPLSYRSNNLAHQALSHHLSFVGYAESMPHAGYTGCTSGSYARKHAPWTDFTDVPTSVSKPMTRFPSDFTNLPKLAFVIPNLDDDMHDGTIAEADTWLSDNLSAYARWARHHNSLLIVTWDEDDHSANNHIPGMIVGAHVRQAHFTAHVDHYRMLRTLESLLRLPAIGAAAHRTPMLGLWTS